MGIDEEEILRRSHDFKSLLARNLIEHLEFDFGFNFNSYGSTSDYNHALEQQGVDLAPLPENKLLVAIGYTGSIWKSVEFFVQNVFQDQSVTQHPFEVFTQKIISKVQQEFKLGRSLETSVIPSNKINSQYIDFNLLMSSLPEGEGSKLSLQKDIPLYLHSDVGCWFGCKFIVIFENIVYPMSSVGASPNKSVEYLS